MFISPSLELSQGDLRAPKSHYRKSLAGGSSGFLISSSRERDSLITHSLAGPRTARIIAGSGSSHVSGEIEGDSRRY
jgi:hypothetical protein